MEHAIISAVVGVFLVFAFLAFLSLLVAVLTRLTADPAPGSEGKAGGSRSDARITASRKGGKTASPQAMQTTSDAGAAHAQPPPWVFAAVAAYLAAEERDEARSATSWAPGPGRQGVSVDARLMTPQELDT